MFYLGVYNMSQYFKDFQLTGDCSTIVSQKKEKNKNLFSYQLSTVFKAPYIYTLRQKATHYSLDIAIEAEEGVFTITAFTLKADRELENKSEALFDAALVDLAIQGFEFIFEKAHQARKSDINFLLSHKDYEQMRPFSSFFESAIPKKDKIFFVLSTTTVAYALFHGHISSLQERIHKTLWGYQRFDKFLQKYLQSDEQENFPLTCKTAGTEEARLQKNNVIIFPIKNPTSFPNKTM